MIKRLFTGQINSITIAALLIALSSLVSRFLGIFRDRILAGEFGAGDTLDVYYAAFRVPDLIFNLLVLGALSAGFIPILTGLIKDQKCRERTLFSKCPNKEAWELSSNLLNIMGAALIAISLVGIAVTPWLVEIIAYGFSDEKKAATVNLTRIMFLSPVFLGISSVLGGVLQSFKRFLAYSVAPILYNLGIIFGALYLAPIYGVYGLSFGVVIGAFLHMMVQIPVVLRLGFKYKPLFDLKNKQIRKIGTMMIPRVMSLGISQINLLVITVIATTLAGGSLAVFNFANNLQSFPIGVIGISFAVAAFPMLSAHAFDREKLIYNFSNVFRQILFFIIPATVLLLTLRAQIIRVVLGTGKFDWSDTLLTMDTLGFFALSLFAQASLPLLVRVFYARHDSKTPFFIGLVSAVVNIILSYYFASIMGVSGLALAFSVANIVNFILLWIFLRAELHGLDEVRILNSSFKFSVAAIALGTTVQGMKLLVWPIIDMTRFWGVFAQGAAAGISGIFVYIAFCSLLKSEEFFSFWESVKRRLPWKKIETGDHGEARGI